jgi:hypothetical protein
MYATQLHLCLAIRAAEIAAAIRQIQVAVLVATKICLLSKNKVPLFILEKIRLEQIGSEQI